MKLTDIVAVAGMPGVHKVISRHKTGLVLENVQTKKRTSTGLRNRASNLNDISIYTEDGDLPLWEIFKSLKALEDKKEELPTHKSSNADLEAGLAKVAPTYDRERVYTSDMKKMYQWYHMVKADLDFDSLGVEPETADDAKSIDAKDTAKASPKKAPTKKAAPKPTKSAGSAATKVPKNSNRGK